MTITSERRTLADLLCHERVESSLATVTDALRRGLLAPGDLGLVARGASGRRGARRAHLIALTCVGSPWSVLEWRFQRIARSISGGWVFNVDIPDGRGLIGPVDAFHEEFGIVVELDGKRFHGPDRFQLDRTRDQRLVALGFVVLRFTWEDLESRPDEVRAIIRRTMSQRMRRAGERQGAEVLLSGSASIGAPRSGPDHEWAARKRTKSGRRAEGREQGAGRGRVGG